MYKYVIRYCKAEDCRKTYQLDHYYDTQSEAISASIDLETDPEIYTSWVETVDYTDTDSIKNMLLKYAFEHGDNFARIYNRVMLKLANDLDMHNVLTALLISKFVYEELERNEKTNN